MAEHWVVVPEIAAHRIVFPSTVWPGMVVPLMVVPVTVVPRIVRSGVVVSGICTRMIVVPRGGKAWDSCV